MDGLGEMREPEGVRKVGGSWRREAEAVCLWCEMPFWHTLHLRCSIDFPSLTDHPIRHPLKCFSAQTDAATGDKEKKVQMASTVEPIVHIFSHIPKCRTIMIQDILVS